MSNCWKFEENGSLGVLSEQNSNLVKFWSRIKTRYFGDLSRKFESLTLSSPFLQLYGYHAKLIKIENKSLVNFGGFFSNFCNIQYIRCYFVLGTKQTPFRHFLNSFCFFWDNLLATVTLQTNSPLETFFPNWLIWRQLKTTGRSRNFHVNISINQYLSLFYQKMNPLRKSCPHSSTEQSQTFVLSALRFPCLQISRQDSAISPDTKNYFDLFPEKTNYFTRRVNDTARQ